MHIGISQVNMRKNRMYLIWMFLEKGIFGVASLPLLARNDGYGYCFYTHIGSRTSDMRSDKEKIKVLVGLEMSRSNMIYF